MAGFETVTPRFSPEGTGGGGLEMPTLREQDVEPLSFREMGGL